MIKRLHAKGKIVSFWPEPCSVKTHYDSLYRVVLVIKSHQEPSKAIIDDPPPPHSLPILGVSPPFLSSPTMSPWYQGDLSFISPAGLTIFIPQYGTITVLAYLVEYPASHSVAASVRSPGPGQCSPTSSGKVWRNASRYRNTSPSRTGGSWRPASVLLMLRYVLPSPLGIL